jgi:hypothetical protein
VADDRWDEQVGSVAEEAQRLLESLRRAGGADAAAPGADEPASAGDPPGGRGRHAADDHGRHAADDHGRHAPDGGGRHAADDEGDAWVCTDPFCRSCPLCRTVAVVRALSPETLRRLADLATVAAGVLSDLAGERSGAPPDATDERAPDERAAPPGRSAPARPIPVRDADEDTARG